MALIFILDDSTTLIMGLSRILKSNGFEIASATDGREGLDKLAAGLKPAIILTDLHMPRVNGIEFLKEVKRNPATRFIPVVVLTAEADPKKREEARLAGASGWLTKPTEPADLLAALKHALTGK